MGTHLFDNLKLREPKGMDVDFNQWLGVASILAAAVMTVLIVLGLVKREKRGEEYLAPNLVAFMVTVLCGIGFYLLRNLF